MAVLAQTIAIATNAGFHGNMKALDSWVNTLTGRKKGHQGKGNIGEFIRQLESAGKVKVRGANRR